jgi:hypothetical protein
MRLSSAADGIRRRSGARGADPLRGGSRGRLLGEPSGGTAPGEGSLAALPPARDAHLELGFQVADEGGSAWRRTRPKRAPWGSSRRGACGARSPRRRLRCSRGQRRRTFKGTAKANPVGPGGPGGASAIGRSIGWASPGGQAVAETPGKSLRCASLLDDGVFRRGIRSDRRVYEALTAKFVPWIPPRRLKPTPVSRTRALRLSKS